MNGSKIDRAFSYMPKMIRVPTVQQSQAYYPQQQQQQSQYYSQQQFQYPYYGSQQPNNQQQPQGMMGPPQPAGMSSEFAAEYMQYYLNYWNAYYQNLEKGGQNLQDSDIGQNSLTLNDRIITGGPHTSDRQGTSAQQSNNHIRIYIDSQRNIASKDNNNNNNNSSMTSQSKEYEESEPEVDISVDQDLLREEFRKKEIIIEPEEEDLIPVNQEFLCEESICEEDFDFYIPETKADPNRKAVELIMENQRIERENQMRLEQQRLQEEEEERKKQEIEAAEEAEHEQFYEENPEIYLEHRKKQKKAIFASLKSEMDKIIRKTQEVEEDLFAAEQGIEKLKHDKEAHSIKTKKLQFYLRAKKIQRDIDDVILQNKEEDLIETNFELLKGLHESIIDDQLERMYEKNQQLFLEVSDALQNVVGIDNPKNFKSFNYYETLRNNAALEMEQLRKKKEKQNKMYGLLLPEQKQIQIERLKRSNSKNNNKRSTSSNKQKSQQSLRVTHQKSWGQN